MSILRNIFPIRNSHMVPQSVSIPEFRNTDNDPRCAGMEKGHTLTFSREPGRIGYHLYVTLTANRRNLSQLKHIYINWNHLQERMFTFRYSPSDECVDIQGDRIRIDIGSFNNCPGSKNFLKWSCESNIIGITLLDYTPEPHNYEYENDISVQSIFYTCDVKKDLGLFRKGVHYVDS